MKSAKSVPKRDRRWRRPCSAGRIELLNTHWPELRVTSPRSCPVCDANFPTGDAAVHYGGELYHPDCAPERRWSPDVAARSSIHPGVAAKFQAVP